MSRRADLRTVLRYEAAFKWNYAAAQLWRRTTIYLPRALARPSGMTQKELRTQVRPSYVKVAEYQRRGLVHLHVLVRLDRAMPRYRAHEIHPPAPRFTVELLEQALRAAAGDVSAKLPDELGADRVCWGDELDVRHVTEGVRGRPAGYLAKYTVKCAADVGGLVHRIDPEHVDRVRVPDHIRSYLRAGFTVNERVGPELRLARCVHQLGYRAHCLTKSRRYSTTFKALREARERHAHEQLPKRRGIPESQRRVIELAKDQRVTTLRYAGSGHVTTADTYLARSSAARAHKNAKSPAKSWR